TGDPVGAGIVANLARPGGNITGLSLLATELSAKRLELLKETLPKLVRVAILWNPNNASVALKFKETETAARMLNLQLQSLQLQRPADLESPIQAAVNARADALVTADDQLLSAQRVQIVSLAMRYRLPVASEFREFAAAGGLMDECRVLRVRPRRSATDGDNWIEQTLVTVDITGTWVGSVGTGNNHAEIRLEL